MSNLLFLLRPRDFFSIVIPQAPNIVNQISHLSLLPSLLHHLLMKGEQAIGGKSRGTCFRVLRSNWDPTQK